MDAETEGRIVEKAEYIEEAVAVLSQKQTLDRQEYLTDRQQRAIVEREFETAIEACIDIAALILKDAGQSMPDSNAGRFEVLGELDVLSSETAETMQEAAGFRNILSHSYGPDIDDTRVYQNLQSQLRWFSQYLHEIREHLS